MAIEFSELIPALEAHLYEWLPRQRWFDAHHDELALVSISDIEILHREWPLVCLVLVDVTVAAEALRLGVVVGLNPAVPESVPDHAIIGEVPGPEFSVMAYEPFADAESVSTVLGHFSSIVTEVRSPLVQHSLWKTTVALGQQWELTFWRRLQPGPNPEVELPTALAEAGMANVRPPAAVWRREGHDLGAVHRNVRHGTVGVELASASLLELLGRRCQPRQNPLDVVDAMTDLGRMVAEIHVALAQRYGTALSDGRELADHLTDGLSPRLDPFARNRMAETYRRLAFADDLGRCIRTHMNLDLSAVELTRNRWFCSDFGGHPYSTLKRSQVPISPIRDLASLLHSIGCVTATVSNKFVIDHDLDGEGETLAEQFDRREMALLSEAWQERSCDAVIAGYTSNDEVHRLLPVERISRDALLTLFATELRLQDLVRRWHARPELLQIPVEELDQLDLPVVQPRW